MTESQVPYHQCKHEWETLLILVEDSTLIPECFHGARQKLAEILRGNCGECAVDLREAGIMVAHGGRCRNCREWITAPDVTEWDRVVREPCPHCGQPGW